LKDIKYKRQSPSFKEESGYHSYTYSSGVVHNKPSSATSTSGISISTGNNVSSSNMLGSGHLNKFYKNYNGSLYKDDKVPVKYLG
jgi:hypothetical protein